MRAEINEIEIKMQQEQNNKAKNQGIFDASITYSNQLKKQLDEAHREKLTIDNKNQRARAGIDDQANRQDELDVLNKECDELESKIRSVTAEPFLRSENKNIGARLEHLNVKYKEQSNQAQELERQADDKEAELSKLKDDYQ
jgi:chromosome segregation ATPase